MRTIVLLLMLTLNARTEQATAPSVSFETPLIAPFELPAQYLLKGARVHTVSGEVIEKGEVLVVDGIIRSVGKRVDVILRKEIDLTGMYLYPALISASSPLGLIEISAVRATRDTTEVGTYTPNVKSWLAINPDSELIPVARAGGVAYSLAIPAGGVVSGQSGLIRLSGWGMEEMAFAKPVALHVNWPSMGLRLTPKHLLKDPGKWKSPADQDKARRQRIAELSRFFDDARAYQLAKANWEDHAPFIQVPAWESMAPYLKSEKPIFVQADDLRQIKAAMAWAQTNRVRIVICGGRDAWMLADQLAERDVPVVYEHVLERPYRDTLPYDQAYSGPAILVEKGVDTAISLGRGRFAASMARNLSHAAAHAQRHGLSEPEALKAITLAPARILGVADRIGSIAEGKIASMIATDRPLLDVRAKVMRMWIAGVEVSLESRQTRLYRRYQRRPKTN